MTKDQDQIQYLWKQVFSGQATEAERHALNQLLADDTYKDEIERLLHETYEEMEESSGFFSLAQKEAMLRNITESQRKPGRTLPIWRWAAAAAVLVGLVAVGIQYFKSPHTPPAVKIAAGEVMPGSNKAVLTLADGSSIVLDDASNGELAKQPGASVVKLDSGSLAYTRTPADGKLVYNTLTTPRGGQYRLVLPDGTVAWLNAASSITYPTAFSGRERSVETSGEVYFEVAHNAQQPFLVKTARQQIEVLGTHFNINAYQDEAAINTTLLEGAIKVVPLGTTAKVMLPKPGQQTSYHLQTGHIQVKPANTATAIAWKNGLFSFEKAGIQEVMRQLSRWYNVDVIYEGNIPSQTFSGDIYRNLELSKALEMLGFVGFHFKIENTPDGKRIIVKP
jgi:transmembrane sensor